MTSEASFRGQGRFIRSWELFASLLFGVLFALAFFFGLFTNLENHSIDARFRFRGELPAHSRIVLVSITDACLEKLGAWPWPRSRYAELLKILKNEGAGAVGFDLIFSEPSSLGDQDDQSFAQAIRESGNVILAQTVSLRLTADPETLEPVSRFMVDRAVPILASAAAGEGFIDMESETLNRDGVIRNLQLQKSVDGKNHYLFGLSIASLLMKTPVEADESGVRLGQVRLPYYFRRVNPNNQTVYSSYLLNYAGPNAHFRDVSFLDVLQGRFTKGIFRDAAVIVGTRARGLSEDVKFSPFGAMAGMEIHANLLQNILEGSVLRRLPPRRAGIMIILVALLTGWLIWKQAGWRANSIVAMVWGGWLGIAWLVFRLDVILEVVPIMLMVPVQWATMRLVQQFYDLKQRNRELARKVRELSLVNEVSQAVNFMGDLTKTLDTILSRAILALSAERGSILLLDERYENLVEESVLIGSSSRTDPTRSGLSDDLKKLFRTGEGIAGEVFTKGEPRLIEHVPGTAEFAALDPEDHQDIHSLICVPLQVRNSSIGVMNVVNRAEGPFDQEDLQLALTMANQAAVVIEKARLFNLATIDGLTGLIVHRHFQSKLEEEFRRAKRYEKPLSLIMTDIDHFKKFNDTWGHQTGDLVLREVARTVRATVRDTDSPARYGGEEFAIILPETDLEGAVLFAERLRQRVEQLVVQGPKGPLQVTISLGVSAVPINPVETTLEMIKLADEALYEAKHSGRNRVMGSAVRDTTAAAEPVQA